MKKLLFLITALAAVSFVQGCTTLKDSKETKFEIVTETIEVDHVGGQYNILFAITNPNPDLSVSASVRDGADWISNIDTSDEDKGEIHFEVAQNNDTETRQAVITVAYGSIRSEVLVIQKGKDPQQEPWIKLLTKEVNVPSQGGNFEIEYEIVNPVEGTAIIASALSGTDWISGIDTSDDGKVIFTADANDGTAQRHSGIILSYGEVTTTVPVSQEGRPASGYDVEFDAELFYGIYYGDYFVDGVANYWFYLMDKEMVNDVMSPEGTYYRIDLYGPFADDPDNAFVPEGTYTYDPASTCAEGTFTKSYSYLIITDASGKGHVSEYQDATLTVTRDGDVFTYELIATIDGKKHRVTYTGETRFTNDSEDEPDVEYPAVTSDIDLSVKYADAYWKGDNADIHNIEIRLTDMDKDEDNNLIYPGIQLDLNMYCLLEDGWIKPGTYTVSKHSAGDAGTLVPGEMGSIFGMLLPSGTKTMVYNEAGQRTFGLVTEGTVEVSGNASGCRLEVDLTMEGKYKMTAVYEGELPLNNMPKSSPVRTVATKALKR